MRAYAPYIEKIRICLEVLLIALWNTHLVYTDSYFSVYAICGAVGLFCLYDNFRARRSLRGKQFWGLFSVALVLSLAVVMGNYSIFQRIRNLDEISMDTNGFLNALEFCVTLAGGLVNFYQIILYTVLVFPLRKSLMQSRRHRARTRTIFLCMTASIWAVYLIYLYLVVYPGSVSGDSMWQITQKHGLNRPRAIGIVDMTIISTPSMSATMTLASIWCRKATLCISLLRHTLTFPVKQQFFSRCKVLACTHGLC